MTDATRDTTIFNGAYTMLFVYSTALNSGNGGWWIYRGYDANTNTIGYQLRTASTLRPALVTGYRYRLWFTALDGKHWIPANESSSTNATSSRTPSDEVIDPFGEIIYNSTNGTVNAGANIPTGTAWQQYTLSLGYSFNKTGAALTLTNPAPVYVKCQPQTSGGVVMKDYTQSLPSTEDGYVYLFLGMAYSATNIELFAVHPCYYYKDGAIRLWTNAAASGSAVDPATATPLMDGTAAVGSSVKYAREDHVHPSDTTKVDKEALDDAGITGITYTTIVDTTTVTTATGAVHPKPYATLASGVGIYEGLTYRITVDGVEYTLQARGWFVRWDTGLAAVSSYLLSAVVNITYFQSSPNFYTDVDNVPFLVTTLVQPTATSKESDGIYVFTETEKSVSVKIELATHQGEPLPNYLIRGETAPAINKIYLNNIARRSYNIGYNSVGDGGIAIGNSNSISGNGNVFGAGNIISANNSIIVGTNNEISSTWSAILGHGNIVSGTISVAVGYANTVSGESAVAAGYANTVSGGGAVAVGFANTASGNYSFAGNRNTEAVGTYSTAHGRRTISNHKSQFVFGECNVADASSEASNARGTYVEIVGNGTSDSARSNARTLDWNGNESLAGGLTLGMGTANQTSITAQQLNALLALASSVPNAASIDANGLITFKNGNTSLFTLQLPIYDGSHHSA